MACHPFAVDALFFALAKKNRKRNAKTQLNKSDVRRSSANTMFTHAYTYIMCTAQVKCCKSENAKKLNSKFSGRPI